MAQLSLSDLVQALGPTVLRVVCAPAGLAHPVGEPELVDVADPAPTAPSALLLGIGLRPEDDRIAEVLDRAGRHRAAALVLKCRDHSPDRLAEMATRSGVAILDTMPDVPWRRLEALCATVLRGASGSRQPGLAEVPHGDLFALANAVAAIAGGATAIMDTNHVIIAYSNLEGQPTDDTRRRSILSRRVPDDALPSFLAPTVWNSRSVVRVKRSGDMDRLAVVVRAGSDVLGSLWVAVDDQDDDDEASARTAALKEAAKLAAPHLLQLRRHAGAEQDRRNEALRTALDSDNDPSGLELPGHLLTLVSPEQVDPARRRLSGLQVEDMVTLDAATFGLSIATTLIGERLYVLVPSAGGGKRQAELFARHAVDRARASLRRDFLGVLGAEVTNAADLRARRADGDSALTHLTGSGRSSGVVDIDTVRADLVLRRITDLVGARPDLRSGVAERIVAHDDAKGTRYATSLRTYLRCFGDITTAAEELHIHQNTLRHRLRRAEELFDLDLRQPDRLLLLWLELTATLSDRPT